MSKFLLTLWSDIKNNWVFNLIIFIEILALILVAGMFMQNTELGDLRKKGYKDEYADAVIMKIDDIGEKFNKDGFKNTAMSNDLFSNNMSATVINPELSRMFSVPYSGNWFSGELNRQYSEALISKKLKNVYKKDEIYNLVFNDGSARNVKIIGYLGNDNISLSLNYTQYDKIFSQRDIMICDKLSVNEIGSQVIIATEKNKQFYIDNYNAKAQYLSESYDQYCTSQYLSDYYTKYIVLLIFGMVVVGVLCNSIFKTEENIKRNTIKYILGNKPKDIALSDIVKSALLFVIPFIIDLIAVAVINSVSKEPLIGYKGFGIASTIVLVIYMLSVSAGLIRTLMAKPLKELRK